MICDKCKNAGNLNESLNDSNTVTFREALRVRAEHLHEQCAGHDCMCQHRVGVYVARGQEVSKAAEQVSGSAGS